MDPRRKYINELQVGAILTNFTPCIHFLNTTIYLRKLCDNSIKYSMYPPVLVNSKHILNTTFTYLWFCDNCNKYSVLECFVNKQTYLLLFVYKFTF